MSRSRVSSNKMAPMTRSPLKLGLVMIRGPHLVHETEHFVVVRVRTSRDSIEQEGLGGAPTALVEGGDEALSDLHLVELADRSWQPF